MAGGGKKPKEDKYAQNVQAEIGRDQYNDYLRRYYPQEIALARELGDAGAGALELDKELRRIAGDEAVEGNTAGVKRRFPVPSFRTGRAAIGRRAPAAARPPQRGLVNEQYDVAEEELTRDLQRYNVTPDATERAAIDKQFNLGRGSATVDALNRTRTAFVDRTDQAMRDAIATGRGVSSAAAGNAAEGARQGAERNAQRQAENAQRQQQRYSNIGTAASLGALIAISDKRAKKKIKPANSRDAKKAIESTDVKSFEYKPAIGRPRGRQMGPIAQEAPKSFRGPDTPEGKTVNIGSMVGALVKNQQDLNKRIDKLEKRT